MGVYRLVKDVGLSYAEAANLASFAKKRGVDIEIIYGAKDSRGRGVRVISLEQIKAITPIIQNELQNNYRLKYVSDTRIKGALKALIKFVEKLKNEQKP